MSSLAIGLIIIGLLLLLLAIGMPVAFALGLTAVLSVVYFLGPAQLSFVGEFIFTSVNNFTLLAIPLFIFMGAVFGGSRAGSDLFDAGHVWLVKLRGGLAMSSVVACGMFAALCGSSAATAAAIGRVAIPQMKKRGYSNQVASGAVVAGGTLGILIPPSVTLILYGIATEQSIGRLFLGGVLPGGIVVLMFCIWISIATRLEQRKQADPIELAEGAELSEQVRVAERYYWADRITALLRVLPFLLLIIGVLCSLYLGYATPSEAAAVGALLSLLLALAYRNLTLKKFTNMLLESARESTMIMMIVAFSAVLGTVMSFLSIPQDLAAGISNLEVNRWVVMLVINLLLLVLGLFLPPVSIILMVMPVIFPIITLLNFDPIWFGVVMSINMEMGLITPPVGLNLYVVKGIAPDISLREILAGSIPYVVILGLAIVLFSFVPEVVTVLPDAVFGS